MKQNQDRYGLRRTLLVGRIFAVMSSAIVLVGSTAYILHNMNAPSWIGYICGAPIWFYLKHLWNDLYPSNAPDQRAGEKLNE